MKRSFSNPLTLRCLAASTALGALALSSCTNHPDIIVSVDGLGSTGNGGSGNGGTNGGGGGSNVGGPVFNETDGGATRSDFDIGNVIIHQRGTATGSITLDGGIVAPTGTGSLPDVMFNYMPTGNGMDAGCGTATAGADIVGRPVDIIVSVDNSGSMSEEILNIQEQINVNFSEILADSGIDYRVIMVTRYGWVLQNSGSDNRICIGPPLGAAACPDQNNVPPLTFPGPTPPEPATQRFFHFSADVNSNNMWCVLLDTFDASGTRVVTGSGVDGADYPSDDGDMNPEGWQKWLREGSFKMFIGITDDHGGEDGCGEYPAFNYDNPPGNSDDATWTIGDDLMFAMGDFTQTDEDNLAAELQGSRDFDRDLRTLSAAHFGAYDAGDPDESRNYRWYSIVGYNDGTAATDPGTALQPSAPLETGRCNATVNDPQTGNQTANTGEGAGIGYQYLSKLTGALRFSSCFTDQYSEIFADVAQGVQDVATVPCEFDIDLDQIDGIINPENVTITYSPGSGSSEEFSRVSSDMAADCNDDNEFYFEYNSDDQPNRIILCPATCGRAQADQQATLQIDFGCLQN